jgi:hypothetical protein
LTPAHAGLIGIRALGVLFRGDNNTDMKIFISWSGAASQAAAVALGESIRAVFAGVDPWISAEDIAPGQQWFSEMMAALEDSRFGIVCLTARTLRAPWLLFESGAVSAKVGSPKLVPLLLDCVAEDLVDPLARFQATTFDRKSVQRLFGSINSSLGAPLTSTTLKASFAKAWKKLERAVGEALKAECAYDVFLSVPMASFKDDSEYKPFYRDAMKVVDALRNRCKLSVFCALEGIDSMDKFDVVSTSVEVDIDNLRNSGSFVMLYPQKLATSAVFEAGYALALGLPCRLFVRDPRDLPFLLRRLPEAFTNVSILDSTDWETYEDIGKCLEESAERWFRRSAVAQRKS